MTTTNLPKQIDRVLSLDEVAAILGRSKKTLWRYAKEKTIPEPLKVNGRAIGYRQSAVESILRSFEGGEQHG
ncbi:helix-turn-helix domain-containing protein [Vibrio alginolyticus]|uniref:helix-turn-helix transcriptional regulator n=1 Tax=Vibrio parahaemolyticus TaxID=670 RepID=UPI001A8DDCD5|nr:helix-turn-helix domain-containing protein [Vibrio parahaemolyticus]EGQ9761963.1 helix-turn-helix domain-containing protein [Vibrio alginolyticus]MBO0152992.1 helix-turn-helix domain-containing protein [Vibrio parahaemolyticus]MDF5477759.1 helix-turn-helix domain-containing protein [Vibrio parahaemolyticus]MDF5489154.1 helix-turn-helix domain-containing protein [Vibrio parahaemolyticus]MDF5505684.1 helix-turn-helix domain-containing protein [Vibrio parahaemolyticus]